jgi:hypothetical protein
MANNNLNFGKYKISERKRNGNNPRTVFYLTPISEKEANIEDYSEKYLIAIRRGTNIERYPECLPNTLKQDEKLSIIDHLKKRSEQIQNIKLNTKENDKEPDFDIFEDVLGI